MALPDTYKRKYLVRNIISPQSRNCNTVDKASQNLLCNFFSLSLYFLVSLCYLSLKSGWLWIQRVHPPGMAAVDQLVVNLAEISCKSFPDTLA